MDPIKNVGTVDYATLQQMQAQNNETIPEYGDYNTMPMVYEPEPPVKKGHGTGMLLTVGALSAAAGVLLGKKVFGGGKAIQEAESRAEEAIQKYIKENEILKKEKAEAEKALENYRLDGWGWGSPFVRFWRTFFPAAGRSKEEKVARKALHDAKVEAEKAEKTAAKEAKKAEKEATKAEKAEKSE